ncbi:hypothetical protein GOP47_0007217 [Adiantum capillus-veneris]|uniref:Receptor-like serine/threonine-protein kinase n=1 Tax=Adiantum capillus-veneris TaxID=13818 RepID=A0A9D4ZJ07_ADICA|nr:hypothetical protein GOP47_0007217 [Adiantum capillus-veneris]
MNEVLWQQEREIMGCKLEMRQRSELLLLRRLLLLPLVCLIVLRVSPTFAKLHVVGSFFSTDDEPSAFWRSKNWDCTFGFQRVASSDAYLLALWFTNDPYQTPIWWPAISPDTSETPLVQKGALFKFSKEASLELWALNAEGIYTIVWSELGSMEKCGFAEVTDTCNLIVYDMYAKVQLWQSYSDPRDCLMLTSYGKGSLEDRARIIEKPYLLQSKQNNTSFAPGRFRVSSDYNQNLVLYAAFDQIYNGSSDTHLETEYIYMNAQLDVTKNFQIWDADGKVVFVNNGTMPKISRLTLSEDGNLVIYSWEANSWRKTWQLVDDKCKLASPCGPFAICKGGMNERVQCNCPFNTGCAELAMKAPRKFSMKSIGTLPWVTSSIKDPKRTCGSNLGVETIDCSTQLGTVKPKFSMLQVPDSDYYYNNLKQLVPDVSLEDCKDLCLQECECVAVSFKASDSGSQCTLKGNRNTRLVMNGYESIGTTLLIKLREEPPQPSNTTSTPTPTPTPTPRNTSNRPSKFFLRRVAVTWTLIGVVVVIAVTGCSWMMLKRKTSLQKDAYEDTDLNLNTACGNGRPKMFTYKEIKEATNRFRDSVGEGGHGKVYKGWIHAEEWVACCADVANGCIAHLQQEQVPRQVLVAVKVLKGVSNDNPDQSDDQNLPNQKHADEGEKQFKAEVSTLGNIHHVNLVSLLGYCATRRTRGNHSGQRILVYEYMENGSLDKYLTMPAILQEDYLPWRVRYSIALDTARGIAYLHHDCDPPIIHCDIKPQNVLLDKNFRAKVADFGLAYVLKEQQSHLTITGVHGTRGYLAPEWLHSGEVTSKIDVYSYGMLLLELVFAGEHAESAPGVIVNRSTLLHSAMQTVSVAAAQANDTSNDAMAPPSQGDSVAASKAIVVEGSLCDLVASNESLNMDESRTDLFPCNDVDIESRELCKDGIEPPADEIEEKLRLIKIGLWCVQYAPTMRPSMSTVVQLLQGTITVANPPNPQPPPPTHTSLCSLDVLESTSLDVSEKSHLLFPHFENIKL